MPDAFEQNIQGVANLIGDDTNKVSLSDGIREEGVEGDYEDVLELPMSDEELILLKEEWEQKDKGYSPKVKVRQERNRAYVRGIQRAMGSQDERVVPTNLMFEATATFVPEALAENPEPVVFSDNTPEGKLASNDLKTMMQYHAEMMSLRRKLGMMVWHWSIYFTAALKYGWDANTSEIKMKVRKPQNFIFDPDGFVDEFGDFKGEFLGERCETTAGKLIELYPKHKTYIFLKVNGKLGTKVVYTEWWSNTFCFSTYLEVVLDKHKNEFFNYSEKQVDEFGIETESKPINHFAVPKMPYTFLSVFSLQERPHDFTNLIEQNIANQDRINDRDMQIDKNLASGQNSVAISGTSFNQETASQAVQTFYEEGFLLIPDGNMEGVKRIPASPLPSGIIESNEIQKNDLRSIYGTLGSTAQAKTEDETARGMILNQSHDSSRVGGGVGDSLEAVAKSAFNWMAQLYCVFYDVEHYGAVMGNARAVEYTAFTQQNMTRKFVISVAANSMKPHDEVSQQNLAMQRWDNQSIDPISLMKELDDPDPMNSAKQLVMWTTNPQQYALTYFPEVQPAQPPMQGEGTGQEIPLNPDPNISSPAESSALSQVPITSPIQMPQL